MPKKKYYKPTGKPFGRPIEYKPEFCQEMLDFFQRPLLIEKTVGKVKKEVVNKFPTFERFAVDVIGKTTETLIQWCKIYPEFSEAYKACKQIQKDMIMEGGMSGKYATQFAIFVATNVTDLRQKVEHDISDESKKLFKLAYNLDEPKK